MPTSSEKKALAFVATVALLGGAVRVVRAGSPTGPTTIEQQALARQATAADSAASAQRAGKHGKKLRISKGTRRDTFPVIIAGIASVPPSYARPDAPNAHAPYSSHANALGFPPPSPRMDVDMRGMVAPAVPPIGATMKRGKAARLDVTGQPAKPMDMDAASESDIERLPGIGPTLARRIIANRDSLGPFASLGGLRRVKGVGPAMAQKLGPLVSFSGMASPRRGSGR